MDAPAPNISQQHMDNPPTGARSSPPGSSTSSSPQNMLPGPPNPFAIAPAGRTPGLSAPLPHLGSRSPGGYHAPSYSHSYPTSSTSPSTASGGIQDTQSNDALSLPASGISPTQISSSSLNPQKRAYRQRRKDPSCDACRERKVKCDATETTACSECSSRNHKCQFTKETNRRMSSIKQVQDLQSQLAELRHENTQLRTRVTDRNAVEVDRGSPTQRRLDIRVSSPNTPKKIQPPVLKNFDFVRKNIQTHSRGIFDLPHKNIHYIAPPSSGFSLPEIPPRADFAYLSRSYLNSIHEAFPILHWPTFQHEVDQVYTAISFEGMSQEWISLFFAVLACGSISGSSAPTRSPVARIRSASYFEISAQALSPPSQELTANHARAALLLSIYAVESNMKSSGSIWLSSAVRITQTLGLHLETERSVFEDEIRRRLWWSIYIWDRITSLEANLPMLIAEDDCDIALPSPLEDRYIQPQGFARPHTSQPPFTGFLAVIQIAQLFSQLHQAMKSSVIAPQTLQSFDEKFHSQLMVLPESYQPVSDAPLDPAALLPLITLQTARFLLFRRNLSPACRPPERAEALHRCTAVAQDTANYISRMERGPSGRGESELWRSKIPQLASNTICMHVWRCILMLCFRADFEGALACFRLSIAIGDTRKVNIACCKNITFFLSRMLEQVRAGNGGQHQLEHDEEMLAYVSGDMQGSLEHSWVWAGVDLGAQSTPVSPHSPPPQDSAQAHGTDEPMQGTSLPLRPVPGSPESVSKEWDGWTLIEHMISQLMNEHHARLAQPTPYYPPPHNPVKRVQLAPDAPTSPPRSGPLPPPTTSSSSRISIANII